jgi:hypothetical protein
MLSTLVFPFVGLALRKKTEAEVTDGDGPSPAGEVAVAPATG